MTTSPRRAPCSRAGRSRIAPLPDRTLLYRRRAVDGRLHVLRTQRYNYGNQLHGPRAAATPTGFLRRAARRRAAARVALGSQDARGTHGQATFRRRAASFVTVDCRGTRTRTTHGRRSQRHRCDIGVTSGRSICRVDRAERKCIARRPSCERATSELWPGAAPSCGRARLPWRAKLTDATHGYSLGPLSGCYAER